MFVGNLGEINTASDLIERFEKVSGLEMHRDPARNKCQALPFGNHRYYNGWPAWITVRDEVKIVGAVFSNKGDIEKLNSNLVSKCFFDALHRSYGVKGTILQKVHFVNTYLFSKVWFLAQCFMMDNKIMDNILSKALNFIYAGENERPIRALNFRDKSCGGLGLINPSHKAKALLMKNMYRDFVRLKYDINKEDSYKSLYGYTKILVKALKSGVDIKDTKTTYNYLIEDQIIRNNSIIPSRSERRVQIV